MAPKSSKINLEKSILINALFFFGFLGSWKINFQNSIWINALIHFLENTEKTYISTSVNFYQTCGRRPLKDNHKDGSFGFSGSWKINFQKSICINALIHFWKIRKKYISTSVSFCQTFVRGLLKGILKDCWSIPGLSLRNASSDLLMRSLRIP